MIQKLHGMVWGPVLLTLLLTVGIAYTLRSGGFPLFGIKVWWRETVGSLLREDGEAKRQKGQYVTKGQAACTALAATIGTGNIVGVATALTAGGPGAIFWMWVSALTGMATAYAETWLGIRYRYKNTQGRWVCGPAVYLDKGLHMPFLGIFYGILCLMASLGMGSMVQSNAITQTIGFSAGVPPLLCGVAVTAVTCSVAAGGILRIGKVAEKLMPWAAGIYIFFSCITLGACYEQIPGAFMDIFRYAFLPESVAGGIGGYGISRAFRYGIARGVFSNEAGLGSLAGLHGATENTTPEEQGMWAMFEVFFDTIVICTLTALVILCVTGRTGGTLQGYGDGAVLTAGCFGAVLGNMGEYLVSGAMTIFAFATMIAWFFLGRQTLETVLEQISRWLPLSAGTRNNIEIAYLILYGYAVFMGCVSNLEAVWALSDIWNGMMAFPNICALLLLQRQVRFPKRK
ncbi:MAG: sodium:alanine symporter family protein [Hungatella sp.]|nr:sodium:alanine symporter family protein [Hungatella sp.]